MGRELEVKLRIGDPADFRRLLDSLEQLGTHRQINTYFDTPDHALARSGCLVRVREESGRIVLTVKSGARISRGHIDSDEWETELDPRLWGDIRSGRRGLEGSGFGPLEGVRQGRTIASVGRLENVRHRCRGAGNLVYELDETTFPGAEVHYELEIETSDPEGELIRARALLDRLGIAYDETVETKYERLLKRLR